MSSLLLLAVCLLLGLGVARLAQPPEGLARNLNWWILNIALPATILQLVPRLKFDWSLWFLPASMWLMFFLSWALFHWLGGRRGWSRQRIGGLILTGGLSNSSFVGFPLIEALRGRQALPYAVVADQLGCFLALAIGGSVIGAIYSGRRADKNAIARKVLQFPPFLALLAGVGLSLITVPMMVDDVFAHIAATLAPLALFSIGLQLSLHLNSDSIAPLLAALGWKLALAPAITLLVGTALSVQSPIAGIALLQTAMGPMMSAAILADEYGFDPPVINLVTGIGVVLSFFTVPLWNLTW